MKTALRTALACALGVLLAASAKAGGIDFDNGADLSPFKAERAPEAPQAESRDSAKKAVWISVAQADLAKIRKAGLLTGVSVMKNGQAAVFKVAEETLPRLSAFMHETFHRCGGFFAHSTRALAEQDLKPAPSRAAVAYTLDQEAWTRPQLERVQEAAIRATIESLSAFHNRYYTADTGAEASQWIASRWQDLARAFPGAKVELFSHSGWKQPSVVLTIPGSETPEEIVVLGGHMDSINLNEPDAGRAPGADDNASGIAVLTETLRVLADAHFKPKRTVQFMAYAAEEVGLRGSQEIAERWAGEGRKVVGVIQYDMTNFKGSAGEIYLLTDNVDNDLTAFLGRLIDTYLGVQRGTLECGYACSDHASWTRNGYPSALPFEASMEEMDPHIHTDKDTLGNTGGDARHSVNFAKLAVAFASELAKNSATGVQ